ncbi:MAG: hypothetical protein SFX73_11995 [Kofleriaceae bacterium]|nr:hypothetical protein [Kofleriaceae bacterium]
MSRACFARLRLLAACVRIGFASSGEQLGDGEPLCDAPAGACAPRADIHHVP